MYDVTTKGIPENEAALEQMNRRVDFAIKIATQRLGEHAVGVMQDTIVPVYNDGHRRPDGRTTDSPLGTPPMTRSGALRASIVSVNERVGFGIYSASVGPMVEYARALELGLVNGATYPTVTPASITIKDSGIAERMFADAVRAAVKGK